MVLATLEMAAKLAILQDARRRLEAELERDEHWRALQRPPAAGEEAPEPSEWQARNRRLQMALDANPVYLAWRNVLEAETLLRTRGEAPARDQDAITTQAAVLPSPAVAVATPELASAPTHPPDAQAAVKTLARTLQDVAPESPGANDDPDDGALSDNLPPEIAALIRAEVEAADPSQPRESDRELREVGERAARAVEKLLAIPSVEPVGPLQLETARRPDRLEKELREIKERRRVQALASSQSDIVTEAARVPPAPPVAPTPDDMDFLHSPAGAPWVAFETQAEEARSPVVTRRIPKPGKPPEGPSRDTFIDRLLAEERPPVPPAETERTRRIVPEEAEVTVVRPGQETITTVAQPAPSPADTTPARPLRRLIKALRGE